MDENTKAIVASSLTNAYVTAFVKYADIKTFARLEENESLETWESIHRIVHEGIIDTFRTYLQFLDEKQNQL